MQAKQSRVLLRVTILAVLLSAFVIPSLLTWNDSTAAAQKGTKPLEKPPENQTYIGAKQCSACHFRSIPRSGGRRNTRRLSTILPAKYKTDASCLKCHTTGHGREDWLPGPQDAGPGWHVVRSLSRSRQQACGDCQEFRQQETVEGRRGVRSQHDPQDYARQRLRNVPPRPGSQKASAVRQKEVIGDVAALQRVEDRMHRGRAVRLDLAMSVVTLEEGNVRWQKRRQVQSSRPKKRSRWKRWLIRTAIVCRCH